LIEIFIVLILPNTDDMDIQNVLGDQVKINAVQEAEPASARPSGFMPKKDNADIT
tara:strand:+ start:316 stop:480 length:165 start_codon:yes stop_codon:yes gene_type:complete